MRYSRLLLIQLKMALSDADVQKQVNLYDVNVAVIAFESVVKVTFYSKGAWRCHRCYGSVGYQQDKLH